MFSYILRCSPQGHHPRHRARWPPLSPLHPALCDARISSPQHSSPSTRSRFKKAAETSAGRQEEAVFVVQLFIHPVGKPQPRAADQTRPRPHPAPLIRAITGMANAGKRSQVTDSRRKKKKKKAIFDGKRLPRAPAAQWQPPAPHQGLGSPEKRQERGRQRAWRRPGFQPSDTAGVSSICSLL